MRGEHYNRRVPITRITRSDRRLHDKMLFLPVSPGIFALIRQQV